MSASLCLALSSSPPWAAELSERFAERGDSCHRVTRRGANLVLVHLPFPLPSPLSQGETASAKMVSLPNEERSEESSYLCVVVFSNGKLRGPVLTLTSSQGLQQAFCCPVSSFYMKDGRDGLTSHLATSPCHLNVQFFCISLLLQKQV